MSRPRLTYANVVATLTAFVVFAGGAAIAADQLAKNSVGSKQLKKNSVTAKKIKKNAVTAAKIKKGAVNGAKVKDGTLKNADLDLASVPFGRLVHRTVGAGPPADLSAALEPLPILTSSYTQEVGSDDSYFGSVQISFGPECEVPRIAQIFLLIDVPNILTATESSIVSLGFAYDMTGAGPDIRRVALAPISGGTRFQPAAATSHSLSMFGIASCGGTNQVTASEPVIEVVGVK